jgi:predicted nucleic acid-binding protein
MLAPPVLHELWMGARGKKEVNLLVTFQNEFVRLKRLIIPTISTLLLIGQSCRRLRKSGKLDPFHPKSYNDISIAAAAHQIGAIVLTKNIRDFKIIQGVIDFNIENGDMID